jgi:hypothetical protein
MANLTERLDEIENILIANQTQLGVWLAAIGLDVAGISPTISAMEANLLASLATLNTSVQETNTLTTAGNTLITTSNSRLTSIASNTNQLLSPTQQTAQNTADSLSKLTAIDTAIGIPSGDATTTVLGRLSAIELLLTNTLANWGDPGDATGTLLATLHDVRACICLVAGKVPTPPTTELCEEPFISTGSAFYPGWPGFGTGANVATWSAPLPDGVVFGTIFGITIDNTELQRDISWNGVLIWVESDAPAFALSFATVDRYPTNQWVSLPDTDNIAISVDSISGIKVYLCIPDAPVGDCYVTGSILQGDGDYVATFSAIPELEPYLLEGTNTLMESAGSYTFTLIAGGGVVNPVRFTPGIPGADLIADIPYTTTEVPLSEKVWYVRSLEPFSVQVCINP